MDQVPSKDGTVIAYTRQGGGPAVVLVGGGLDDGSENAPLVPELARRFTVVNYARRGRGASGDTPPYALERELEDLDALIAETGGPAHLYGVSSGGALALEAAAAGLAIDRLAVYEVPYCTSAAMLRRSREYLERLGPALAEGRRGDAVGLFMALAGASDDDIAGARRSPFWPGLEALAHTLAYDAACASDFRLPTARLATISRPTLVTTGGPRRGAHGGGGGLPPDFYERAAEAIAAAIPGARRQAIPGQGHVADPKAVAQVLEPFFGGPAGSGPV